MLNFGKTYKMKTKEKFLIRLKLNGQIHPIYWLIHEIKDSEINIYIGSYIIGQKNIKTSVHNSGMVINKDLDNKRHILSHPQFSQKLESLKGIQQILAGVVIKREIDHYQLRTPKKINDKHIIDIDISHFKEFINLHIEIVDINNYEAIELYRKALPIKPKFEEIIKYTSPWLCFVAFD